MTESPQLGPMPERMKEMQFGFGEWEFMPNPAYAAYWQRAARMALELAAHDEMCNRIIEQHHGEFNGKCDCGLDDLRKSIESAP